MGGFAFVILLLIGLLVLVLYRSGRRRRQARETKEFVDRLVSRINQPVSYTHLTLPTNREV